MFTALTKAVVAAASLTTAVGGVAVTAHAESHNAAKPTMAARVAAPNSTALAAPVASLEKGAAAMRSFTINPSQYQSVAFASPSGNLGCALYQGNTGVDKSPTVNGINCLVPKSGSVVKKIPTGSRVCRPGYSRPAYVNMHGGAVRWNCDPEAQLVLPQVSVASSEDTAWSKAHLPTRYSSVFHSRVYVLPYGTTLHYGKITVTSTTSGIIVHGLQSGHGFKLNREQISTYGQKSVWPMVGDN